MINYAHLEEINARTQNPLGFIQECENNYQRLLEQAANAIMAVADEKPVVLISGPSGSGKTTTAHRIEILLRAMGRGTHTLSMDNYYWRPAGFEIPVDDEGQADLETPLIVDSALLREQVHQLINGKTVDIPYFDFVRQTRGEERTPLTRKKGEIIVIEGIHALNPEVVGDAHRWGTGIYVSVRTRLKDPNGFVLHPSKIRLLRRLMRDKRGRGQSFEATVGRLRSVNRGERLYIMPNKHHADISLDTFCPYELPVYRDILLGGLLEMDSEFMEDCDVSDMAPMLRQIAPMSEEGIPKEALIREFIGGGLV